MSRPIIECIPVGSVFVSKLWPAGGYSISFSFLKKRKENSFIMVFSRTQKNLLEKFLKRPEITILYISPKARNCKKYHEDSANTVVVFELND